jgi:sugar transferase (PEP-CTERM/EpsH1 system associated)
MKILQLSPRIPYPLNTGGSIGIFNITKHLAKRGHEIHMVALGRPGTVDANCDLHSYCQLKVVDVRTETVYARMLLNLFTKQAYTLSKYNSPLVYNEINNICRRLNPDVVHVDHLHMAWYGPYVRQRWDIPIALREHDVVFTIWERLAATQRNALQRFYIRLQTERIKRFERNFCTIYDRVVAISDEDRQRLLGVCPTAKVSVIPGGVDTEFFRPLQTPREELNILFVGGLNGEPNIDAVTWFARAVWPIVACQCPETDFTVVGSRPSVAIKKLASDRVKIVADVPDVRPYLSQASVFVVPMRVGGGIRLKILEALAMKKAIVSTSIGCEGIALADGTHLLIADNESDFAKKTIQLLRNPRLGAELGENGYRVVTERYSWESVAGSFEAEYEGLVRQGATMPQVSRGDATHN